MFKKKQFVTGSLHVISKLIIKINLTKTNVKLVVHIVMGAGLVNNT